MSARLNILVVEDDVDLGDTIAAFLREDGHQVIVAVDGASAMDLARRAEPLHAVILDLNLPDLLGYDLARALRADVVSDSATIIMVTGATTAELDRANAVGIDIVLHKPVDAVVFGRLIEFVRKRRRRQFSLMPLRVSTSDVDNR